MTAPERRVLHAFRQEFAGMRDDLDAFDAAFRAADFAGCDHDAIREWCHHWWEERLGGRVLDRGGRRLRGAEGRN